MTNFTVYTDEQLVEAKHNTTKHYFKTLREVQAENARLRAFAMEAIDMMSRNRAQRDRWLGMLAALGETK